MQRRTSALLIAVIATVATVGVTAPAHAAPPPYGAGTQYVALGDSYSAGLGAPGSTLDCGRSPNSYPNLWAAAHGITDFIDATCSGATTDDVVATQIASLSAETDVVTITIGGNDAVLGNLYTTCIQGNAKCEQVNAQFDVDIDGYLTKVGNAYDAIRAAAPDADVYVLGYPRVFETGWLCFGLLMPSQYQRTLIAGTFEQFNAGLAALVGERDGFHWVDATPTFAGHGVCSSSPWINPPVSLPGPLHPNGNGQKLGYLAALTAVTG